MLPQTFEKSVASVSELAHEKHFSEILDKFHTVWTTLTWRKRTTSKSVEKVSDGRWNGGLSR